MPEETGAATEAIQPPPAPPAAAPDGGSGLNPWLLLALLAVAVLVSIQNLWLRHRGEGQDETDEGP
jgi:hypothetical protein